MITPDEKKAVVEAYLRGAKTSVIQRDFSIGPGDLYRILHEANVPLRRQDTGHPPNLDELIQPSAIYEEKSRELAKAEVEYFKGLLEAKLREYAASGWPTALEDARMEVSIDYLDPAELAKRIEVWLAAYREHGLGGDTGLAAFKKVLEDIAALQNGTKHEQA